MKDQLCAYVSMSHLLDGNSHHVQLSQSYDKILSPVLLILSMQKKGRDSAVLLLYWIFKGVQ